MIFRLDLGLEELRFAAEYDGEEFHGHEHEGADAERRAVLSGEFGWPVEVFRRERVFGQRADASVRLAQAFHDARRTFTRRSPWSG